MTRRAGELPAGTSNQALFLNLALEAGAMGTWAYDTGTGRLQLDAAEFELFDIAPEHFTGKLDEALKRIHNDDRHRVEVALRNAIAAGGTFKQEFRVVRSDGDMRWLSGLGRPGAEDTFVGVTADKTTQPSALMALADSERRLRLASEAAKLGAFEYDAASRTLILDPRAQAVLRCSSSVLSLDEWFELMHPDDREVMHDFTVRAIDPSDPLEEVVAHYRIVVSDQEVAWIEGRCFVLFTGHGDSRSAQRAIGTVQDITERKSREEALAKSNAILDTMFETAPIGIGLFDLDRRFVRVNRQLARINGIPAEEHAGKRPEDLLPSIDRIDQVLAAFDRIVQTGEPLLNVDVTGETPAEPGIRRSWSESFFPIQSGSDIVGVAVLVKETTQQKLAETQRELLVRELNHRVKNTLTLVQSIANSSLRLASSPKAFVDAFSGRLEALARAHDMIVEANWKQIDLETLIKTQAVVDRVDDGGRIVLKGPSVALNNSDGVMFGLAIHELATNARKYGALSTPDGHVDVSWDVSTTDKGIEILFKWQESGGPTVKSPDIEGFGYKMVQTAIGEYGGGEVAFDFDPAGLRCLIRFPVEPAILT